MQYQIVSDRKSDPIRISYPNDITPFLYKKYGKKRQEHFLVIALNGAHEIQKIEIVSIGLVNRALVHPREIFKVAIAHNSTAIIIAHNHPSGNLERSREDDEVTERLKKAGDLMGIPVLDHIIFTKDSYMSYLEEQIL